MDIKTQDKLDKAIETPQGHLWTQCKLTASQAIEVLKQETYKGWYIDRVIDIATDGNIVDYYLSDDKSNYTSYEDKQGLRLLNKLERLGRKQVLLTMRDSISETKLRKAHKIEQERKAKKQQEYRKIFTPDMRYSRKLANSLTTNTYSYWIDSKNKLARMGWNGIIGDIEPITDKELAEHKANYQQAIN